MTTAITQAAPATRAVPRRAAAHLLLGAANLAAAFALTWALWHLLLDPNGVVKWYTPMYGFSLVAVLAAVLVAMGPGADGWPFRSWRAPAPLRGAVAAATAVALTAFVVHGFFWGFLGRWGVTYFSPRAIVAAGGVGAEFFNARENASTAVVYLSAAFLWVTLVLSLGFGPWPWQASSPGVRAFSRLSVSALLAAIAYAVLFHPHVTQLFYPAQIMAGVPPWWAERAQTGSAYFNLGGMLSSVAVLVVVHVIWDGAPWRAIGRGRAAVQGIAALAGSVAIGTALFEVALAVMERAWGEPFQGGQYTDAPYFRYLHAGELAGFLVLATFALDTYFGAPRAWAGRAVRTLLAAGGAGLLYVYYYSEAATRMLGKVQGIAQPEDTPLVFTLLFLSVVLVQRDLLDGWPLSRGTERT
jgi:AAT family amino acid transporter